MNRFREYLSSLAPLSDAAWQALQPALSERVVPKSGFLWSEGRVCQALYFLEEGYVRAFTDLDGADKNLDFHFEGEVVTHLSSFAAGTPADYGVQACEKVRVTVIDRHGLFAAAKAEPELETAGKACLRLTAARSEEHARLFKLYTPLQRYEYLEQQRPELLQRVSLTQLSSYLGVARETLSRIRKRRAL